MTTVALLTLAAMPQSLSTFCQIAAAPGAYSSVTISGTTPPESISGYKFVVAAGPGGTLPLISRDLGPSLRTAGEPLSLFKKTGDGTYQPFCRWNMTDSPANNRGGLLLPAGEYLYAASANGPLYDNVNLLGGEWISATAQRDYFAMQIAATEYVTIATSYTTQTYPGLRFMVKNREDAQYPIIAQVTHDFAQIDQTIYLYKRASRTIFTLYASWKNSKDSTGQGLIITPGEYAVRVQNTTRPASFYSGSILLTGRFGSQNP